MASTTAVRNDETLWLLAQGMVAELSTYDGKRDLKTRVSEAFGACKEMGNALLHWTAKRIEANNIKHERPPQHPEEFRRVADGVLEGVNGIRSDKVAMTEIKSLPTQDHVAQAFLLRVIAPVLDNAPKGQRPSFVVIPGGRSLHPNYVPGD